MIIIKSPSPNYSRTNYTKKGVMIHKTLGLMPWTLRWLQNPVSFASAHYLIAKNGDVHELVSIDNRAWSAGRISQPSERAKKIMIKDGSGAYVKPGHYLIQIEYECLLNETYTDNQYDSSIKLFKTFPFQVTTENLLTHKDTAIDKPDLENERIELLKRLSSQEDCELILAHWGELRAKFENGKIVLYKVAN